MRSKKYSGFFWWTFRTCNNNNENMAEGILGPPVAGPRLLRRGRRELPPRGSWRHVCHGVPHLPPAGAGRRIGEAWLRQEFREKCVGIRRIVLPDMHLGPNVRPCVPCTTYCTCHSVNSFLHWNLSIVPKPMQRARCPRPGSFLVRVCGMPGKWYSKQTFSYHMASR